MKPVAVFLVAMSFYCPVTYGQSKENYRQFDEGIDQNGIGFGPVFQGTDGLSIYYDRNYHNVSKQVHIQYEIARGESKTVLGVPVAEVQQTSLHGSLRHVVNSGWYLGGVLGWYNTTLDVHQSGLDSKTPDHDLYFYGASG